MDTQNKPEQEYRKCPVSRPPLDFPEPVEDTPKKRRIPRDYFEINDTPENVARIIMNTMPKKRGEWEFEMRD